ncbi:CoA transferase [Pseudorhodoplanes sp.]|uniref:CaiB/BaiF CoA transferase family protein n=1 Tax=Pseudorhodoplanes sp. TaxID=1934341 RepID=UPI002B5F137A|nr:CoA transferase [Pseudorhodoplanes sp.]HWV52119.1 CoA transferase [Pseudorhodoplanes sp.]
MPASNDIPRASTALARFTVLDLTRVRAGPTCARQLADWGANVIKIEAPERLEGGDPIGGARHGADFQNLHRNKRSITLDLKSEAGRAALLRLVEHADVVIENYRPDVKRRLRIDYLDLKAINPRIVYASISAYGQDGPYEKWPGFDQIAQGMGGIMSVTGLPGQGPVRAGAAVADMAAGLFAALGVMTALLEREQSGEGQYVETSLLAAQIFLLDFQAARWLIDKEVPGQAGNNHPTSVPTGVYKTKDGHINIATTGSPTWVRFCKAIEGEHLIEHPDYATNALRLKNRDALNADIEKALASDTSASWIERLNAAGVAAGPIYKMDEVFADKQVQHLGIATDMQTPDRGTLQVIRQPFSLSRTPSTIAMHTPERGEHTDEVLAEFGFSNDEIDALKKAGAV